MPAISLDGVSKVFDDGTIAVDDLDLDIATGEFLVLLGPSGCGKSTTLRMIAGLEEVTSGVLRVGHRVVNDLPPGERDIAMVFQSFALYPHFTVRDNIAFPLTIGRVPAAEVDDRVADVADALGIGHLLDRRPHLLSGGEQQRVAMARALVRRPAAFLMDEPLSNLDAGLRADLRAEIATLTRHLGVTTVYVTHDQVEALTMADRVAVLRAGRLHQVGTPQEMYDDPRTLFVAGFLGQPRMNLLQAEVYGRLDHSVEIDLGTQRIRLPWEGGAGNHLGRYHGSSVTIGLRPDAIHLAGAGDPAAMLTGRVRHVEYHGHETLAYVDTGSRTAVVPDLVTGRGGELPRNPPGRRAGTADRGLLGRLRALGDRSGGAHSADTAPRTAPRGAVGTATAAAPDYAAGERYRLADLVMRVPAASRLGTGDLVHLAVDADRLAVFDDTGARIPFTPVPGS